MLRSMYSGVSGLKAHQLKMDVIGNNIANVNTTAFKSSNVSFQEVFSQTVKGALPPTTNGSGGANPQQIGLGVSVGNITTVHAQGSIQSTDNANDLAIDGNGFFVVSDGTENHYTRAGNFDIDKSGNIVASNGAKVMGWNRKNDEIDINKPLEAVNVANRFMPAKATEQIEFTGNIDSDTEEYDAINDLNYISYNISIFDSLGESHTITFKFMKTGSNTYDYDILENDADMTINSGATGGSITFGADGKISGTIPPVKPNINISFTTGAANIAIPGTNLIFDPENFTQYANTTEIEGEQDGYTSGTLDSWSIDREGKIVGTFSNGHEQHMATLAIASFINPAGLEKTGYNQYVSTWNSGEAEVGIAGEGGRGLLTPQALEMSNVDLSKEFTEMIVAQRGFQANSRIITASDELLQELVNLKR